MQIESNLPSTIDVEARLDQIAREKQETRKADVRARGKSRLQVQRGRRREAPKPTDVLQRLASSAPDLVEASPARDTLNSRQPTDLSAHRMLRIATRVTTTTWVWTTLIWTMWI